MKKHPRSRLRSKGDPGSKRQAREHKQQDLERDVATVLDFFQSAGNPDAPVTDAQAEYVLRMTADLSVSAERLSRIEQLVTQRCQANAAAADRTRAGSGAEGTGGASSAPRPSFWRRCRELDLPIDQVGPRLRVNDEVLLELERGYARRVPLVFLRAAASLVQSDVASIARCFVPCSHAEVSLAAHDTSGGSPEVSELYDFLTIVEGSDLSGEDKAYWREVIRSEDTSNTAKTGDHA